MAHRAFTVEEANDLFPAIEEILDTLEARQQTIATNMQQLHILDAMWGDAVVRKSNPDHTQFVTHRDKVTAIYQEIQKLVNDELLGRGLRFPAGGLEHGLVDFPTNHEGRWVYLCWQRGEGRVRFWHEIDGGYNGRRDISEVESLTMGKEYPLPDDSALDL